VQGFWLRNYIYEQQPLYRENPALPCTVYLKGFTNTGFKSVQG